MNNELKLYHEILFLELRPWTNREVADFHSFYQTLYWQGF